MSKSAPLVVCFGEILWDFLPRGLFPGGAPFNVAYHLHGLGLRALLVSGVGRDLLGDELLRRLRAWHLPVDGVSRHRRLRTGYVTATLGRAGDAHYQITRHVAWDHIGIDAGKLRAAASAQAMVFGSLAQRSVANRTALDRLLDALPPKAERIFDVNLRPPHDNLALVLALARRATLLKLNAHEAARLAGRKPAAGRELAHARALAERTGCAAVCISAGARGAGIFEAGEWHWVAGRRTKVRDTVGAGDAFLAGLLAGRLLHRESPAAALRRACRMGEFVAARDGATPHYRRNARGQPIDSD
ncbi:MAG TPA: PfkB family carbohydrate kinase [Lacunisphaera sp.]|nr:PfkB family carbohydrate kinase [Lacunisphaera sp.]